MAKLVLYNTLSRKKETFTPVNPGRVGLYVCGPTVYGHPHLGHARPAITFDILFRFLKESGYTVRYVRNITDVGHLEADADSGDDKISKKAVLEQLEPMEIVQIYSDSYHKCMDLLNVEKPSIEPRASGHIIEQQEMIQKILDEGYAYESKGSVYFDVEKYDSSYNYGILSGRILEDLMSSSRDLDGQAEKRNPSDFALWKKASPEHLMRWPSKWSLGFPGWHLECSAMGTKYLGEEFDIHGGGMDLLFPHHECEIAQSRIANGKHAVRYWIHNNMITINGQKMGKSLGNFINLEELFSGDHKLLEQAYSPMTIRFFILQAHYRSTLDFSNEALKAAEKGYSRLMKAMDLIDKLNSAKTSDFSIPELAEKCDAAIHDDMNTPILLAHLFEGVKWINQVNEGRANLKSEDIVSIKDLFQKYVLRILGLRGNVNQSDHTDLSKSLIELLLQLRKEAKENKDYAKSDEIRDQLVGLGIKIKDGKDGSTFEI